MKIIIRMDNGLGGSYEIDEMLLDQATLIPINFAIGQIRPLIKELIERRHEEPPKANGCDHPFGHSCEGQQDR